MPINRIVAFLGPLIAVVAGAVADWLFVHVHFLSNFHTAGEAAGVIAQVIVWGVTSILVWLGESKWLEGWQRYEETEELLGNMPAVEPPPTHTDPVTATRLRQPPPA